jgi:V8-like Glu-specific endopeptidase
MTQKATCLRRSLKSIALAMFALSCSQSSRPEDTRAVAQRIIGGTPSPTSQDAVTVFLNNYNDSCTAVVVAPTLVLTSRHFFFSSALKLTGSCEDSSESVPVSQQNDLSNYKFEIGNQKPVSEVLMDIKHIYSGSDLDLCHNDIALVELDRAVNVSPLPMRLDGPTHIGEQGTLVGWGYDAKQPDAGGLIEQRHQIQLQITSVGQNTFTTDQGGCIGDTGAPFLATQAGNEVGAIVGLLNGIKPASADGGSNTTLSFSDCADAQNVFQTLAPQSAWIRDAFAQAGQVPWLETLNAPAPLGASCNVDAECESGLCVGMDARFCSVVCSTDNPCPNDLECLGPAGKQLCLPARAASAAPSSAQGCAVASRQRTGRPWTALGSLMIYIFFYVQRRSSRLRPTSRNKP